MSTVNPIAYTKQSLTVFEENYKDLNNIFDENILIENITQHDMKKASTIRESDFINQCVQNKANVDVLFDITNMFVTAHSLGVSFNSYAEGMPWERVRSIHVAGYEIVQGMYQDTHAVNLGQDILELTVAVLRKTRPEYLFIERDFNMNNDNLLDELIKLQNVISAA